MRIGMIAGSGQFPILFSKKAQSQGHSVHAAAIIQAADPRIEQVADTIEWVHPGQVQRMIDYFKGCRVGKAVMLGAVDKTRMFTDIRPDARAIAIVAAMKHTHDDALLRAFADALEGEGIEILPSTIFLPDLLAPKGCWTKRKPTDDEAADIRIGYRVAKSVGSLDIGQSVVVGGGSVLAVEAIDGTDATMKRGGMLGKGHSVAVKTSKPGQDTRFDVPAVGIATLEVMQDAGIRVLAVEAGKTIVFDLIEMVALADRYEMTVLSIDEEF